MSAAVATQHRPGWVALVFVAIAAVALWPVKLPIVLGAWFASIARPVARWLANVLGGRTSAAALLTVLLVLAIVVPATVLGVNLAQSAVDLVRAVLQSRSVRGALEELVSPKAKGGGPVGQQALQLAQQHGAEIGSVVKIAFGLTIAVVLGLFLLAVTAFSLLHSPERMYRWAEEHAPLRREHFARMASAFSETGRGLFTSVGLTAVSQGILVTITYLALGIPRPWVLGFLTAVFSIMPLVGTPLVWIPLAIGLFLTGSTTKGILMLVIGGGVIALVENLISPWFARLARFRLPTPVMIISMFGGVLGIGPSGILLGPLALRLAQEALEIAREERAIGA